MQKIKTQPLQHPFIKLNFICDIIISELFFQVAFINEITEALLFIYEIMQAD